MAKLFIITAGTSLLSRYFDREPNASMRDFDLYMSDIQIIDLLSKDFSQWFRDEGVNFIKPDNGNILNWVNRTYAGRIARDHVFAELATLKTINPQPEDRFVILASDTKRGVFCAMMLAYLISPPDATIISDYAYHGRRNPYQGIATSIDCDTGNRYLRFSKGLTTPVRVIQCQGLNPADKTSFERDGISSLIDNLVTQINFAKSQNQPLDPTLIFTGGFKASIPMITQVAAWMGCISMIALYEDSKEIIRYNPLPSPPEPSLMVKVLQAEFANLKSVHTPLGQGIIAYSKKHPLTWNGLYRDEKLLFEDNSTNLSLLGKSLLNYVESELEQNPSLHEDIMNAIS
jgi:hypothetical protein